MNVVNKWISRIMVLIAAAAMLLTVRELVFTDSSVRAAFAGLMGTLPFAKLISDIICGIMKINYEVPLITYGSVIKDLIKLSIMALFQGPITAFLTAIFLPVPAGSIDAREGYMNSAGYQIKSTLMKILSAPLIAVFAAVVSNKFFLWLTDIFGEIGANIVGILSSIALGSISALILAACSVGIGTAFTVIFVTDILGKLATTVAITIGCMAIYIAWLGGVSSEILAAGLTLFLLIAGIDMMMGGVKKSLR